jgi:hypothetical protein
MADVIHELKTWPDPFAAVLDGTKTHEIRVADRPYAVGDVLHLREWGTDDWRRMDHAYTGRECRVEVTYLSSGGSWGIPVGLCVMSIRIADASTIGPARRICHGGDRCAGWPECESCGPVRQ